MALGRLSSVAFVLALLSAPALAGCLASNPLAPQDVGSGVHPAANLAAGLPGNVLVTTRNGPASEVTVAVNPTDPSNLVGGAKDFTLGPDRGCGETNVWSGVYWSTDGGATWGNRLMPGYPGDGNRTLLSRYECNSDPVVAFGPDGTAYYSGLAYGGATRQNRTAGYCPTDERARLCGWSVWIARSTDGGATWGGFVNVAQAGGQILSLDKQWFAVDPNDASHLVMTFLVFTPEGPLLMASESHDGAATWSPPVRVAAVGSDSDQFAMPQFGPNGTVYVTFLQYGDADGVPGAPPEVTSQIMFTRTVSPGTLLFQPAQAIETVHQIPSPLPNGRFRTSSSPVLAVDTSDGPGAGTLYVVWPDEVPCSDPALCGGGHSEVLLIASHDGGASWTRPTQVSRDGTLADKFMPWATVDARGGLDVAYYDRHYATAPGEANTLLDITLARSADGGRTFHGLRVTNESWLVPDGCRHQSGPIFIGDYMGLATGGGVAHPFWADGRSGTCQVMTASVPLASIANGSAWAGNAG